MFNCDEVPEDLLAGPEESLPTEEQEREADEIRSDTPISMEKEDADFEWQIHPYETVKTSITTVSKCLAETYPDEDFEHDCFKNMLLPRYLTNNVTRFEFFLSYNQHGTEYAYHPENKAVRMIGYIFYKEHGVYHHDCLEEAFADKISTGFSKATISTEAPNSKTFLTMVADSPSLFFCAWCDHYIFDSVMYYDDSQFKIDNGDDWPKCEHIVQSVSDENDNSICVVKAHRIFCTVDPQEPPRKKARRQLTYE